jgi:phage anti-repressor protein
VVQTSRIGLLNEKPLHASLKQWYARPGDRFEVPVDGFVVDIVRDDLLIEIQTRNFSSINSKLCKLTQSYEVRLVYPVVQEKWIVRLDGNGGGIEVRRKSPKRGRLEDLFRELVSIPQLLSNPNFSLEVLMIREEEVRRYEKKRRWRRKGWVVEGRRLVDVLDRRLFRRSADWLAFVPNELQSFTTKDLATVADTGRELAQKMAYCLRHARMIELIGRQGRANLYRRC